jgi:hypothetical protein
MIMEIGLRGDSVGTLHRAVGFFTYIEGCHRRGQAELLISRRMFVLCVQNAECKETTSLTHIDDSVYSTLTFSAYHPICTSCVDCSETTTLHLRESRSSIHQAKISITSPLSPHIRNPCAALNHSISSNALTLLSTLLPPSTAWKLCTLSSADIIKNVCNPNVRTVCACPPELFAGEPEASG